MRTRKVGVVDLGRARAKASVWQEGDGAHDPSWRASVETGQFVSNGRTSELKAAVSALLADVRKNCDVVVVVGGSLLRDEAWRGPLLALTSATADAAYVLSPEEEGTALFASLSGKEDGALLDIGGGSVQLVYTEAVNQPTVASWDLGTYALEERHGLVYGSHLESYEHVGKIIADQIVERHLLSQARLVVGSNIMGSFFRRLSTVLGVTGFYWSPADIARARRYCAELPEDLFASTFPENPGFMFGADKAMLLTEAFAGVLGSSEICGSNVSVSEGVAKMVLAGRAPGTALA